MSAFIGDDIVLYSDGIDSTLSELSNQYIKAFDDQSASLKNAFYAVMMHGSVDYVDAGDNESWGFRDLAFAVNYAWSQKGRGRAILMLSCYMGYGMARPLARATGLPIVAGRSAVTISAGKIMCVEFSDASRNPKGQNLQINNRPDWVFVSPTGQIEVVPFAKLDKKRAVSFAARFSSNKV